MIWVGQFDHKSSTAETLLCLASDAAERQGWEGRGIPSEINSRIQS